MKFSLRIFLVNVNKSAENLFYDLRREKKNLWCTEKLLRKNYRETPRNFVSILASKTFTFCRSFHFWSFFYLPSLILNQFFTLRKKWPYSVLFWSAFSRIRTEYGKIRTRITPNTDTFRQCSLIDKKGLKLVFILKDGSVSIWSRR